VHGGNGHEESVVDYYDYYGGWREKTFSCLCGWDEAGG